MSKTYFGTFLKNLIENQELIRIYNPEKELIKINTQRGPAIFFNEDDFNNNLFEYINAKIENEEYDTDSDNNCQICNAPNIIYVDGDFIMNNVENQFDFCKQAAFEAIEEWDKALKSENIEFYRFTFIPKTFKDNKGGFHTFYICKKPIKLDDKKRMYNSIIEHFKFSNQELMIPNKINKILDIQPIISQQVLLPFAQKKGGRNYTLNIDLTNYDYQNYYGIAVRHYETASAHDTLKIKNIVEDNNDSEIQQILNEHYVSSNIDIKDERGKYGMANKIVINFVRSLKYLSEDHIFWNLLRDNKERLRIFVWPLMRYLQFNYILEKRDLTDIPHEKICHLTTILIQPLLEKSILPGEKTERATYKSIYNHCDSIKKYGGDIFSFNKHEDYDNRVEYGKMTHKDILKYINIRTTVSQEALLKHLEPYEIEEKMMFFNKYGGKKKLYEPSEEEQKKNEGKITVSEWAIKCKGFLEIKSAQILNNWTRFVRDFIMNGIKEEILPFTKNQDEKLTFLQVLPKSMNPGLSITENLKKSFYLKTVRNWTLMFFFVSYYNSQQVMEAIREVINTFIRDFIWISEENGELMYLIYNVQQTESLRGYPYNQWLADEKGRELEKWMCLIYNIYIKPLTEVVNKVNGISNLIKNLSNAGIPIKDKEANNLKPINNIGREIRTIFENTVKTFALNKEYHPEKKTTQVHSPYFPMRNGWLEWIEEDGKYTGEYRFVTDNRHRYMERGTNVLYREEYDKNCKAYQDVSRMIEQIYPSKEGRDYCMSLFSSVLYGIGTKDQLLTMYGTGSDGKTTIINALQAMLGAEGFSKNIPTRENGIDITLNLHKGLASNIKPDILLTSNNKNGHDEGGKAEMIGVRLCNAQEPDTRLSGGMLKYNGSCVKEVTSGSAVPVRRIFSKNTNSYINTFITFQTNTKPGTNDTTTGFKRRHTMYSHQAKFQTGEETSFKYMKYSYKADPILAKNIIENPLYWEALFQYLLPYAQNNLRNGHINLSSIEKPEEVKRILEDMYENNVSPCTQMLNSAIVEIEDDEKLCILNVKRLIDAIIELNNIIDDKFLEGGRSTTNARKIEVANIIQDNYLDRIYVNKVDFYSKGKNKRKISNIPDEVLKSKISTKEFIQTYLEDHAVPNMSSSRTKDYSDLWIINSLIDPEDFVGNKRLYNYYYKDEE